MRSYSKRDSDKNTSFMASSRCQSREIMPTLLQISIITEGKYHRCLQPAETVQGRDIKSDELRKTTPSERCLFAIIIAGTEQEKDGGAGPSTDQGLHVEKDIMPTKRTVSLVLTQRRNRDGRLFLC